MEVQLTINRKFLHGTRPDFFYFMLFTVFPRTETNAHYPGAAALITGMRTLFTDYGNAKGAHNTPLADEIYQNILTAAVVLLTYVENNCTNNLARLEETGFVANKTHGTPEPLTGQVTNVHYMTLGEQKIKLEYASDAYAHYFLARVREVGTTEWIMNGRSESHTMFISSGLVHGKEYEIEICGNGTQGQGLWSEKVTVLVV